MTQAVIDKALRDANGISEARPGVSCRIHRKWLDSYNGSYLLQPVVSLVRNRLIECVLIMEHEGPFSGRVRHIIEDGFAYRLHPYSHLGIIVPSGLGLCPIIIYDILFSLGFIKVRHIGSHQAEAEKEHIYCQLVQIRKTTPDVYQLLNSLRFNTPLYGRFLLWRSVILKWVLYQHLIQFLIIISFPSLGMDCRESSSVH